MLKKSITLLMSVFILTQSINIHMSDIIGLNSLLKHFEFHEATYGDDLISFISKHYGNNFQKHDGESGDDHDHHKLPFNHHRNAADIGYIYVAFNDHSFVMQSNSPDLESRNFYYYNFYSYLENTDIFQPPRNA